ncbi:hypothetical protein CsSME_00015918 [Camellia sinensis var. sinensis]
MNRIVVELIVMGGTIEGLMVLEGMVEWMLGISKALGMLMVIKGVMVGILLGTRMMAIGRDGFIRVRVRVGVDVGVLEEEALVKEGH